MKASMSGIRRFAQDETGVTLMEYALLASLIAVVCFATIAVVGGSVNALYVTVCDAFGVRSC